MSGVVCGRQAKASPSASSPPPDCYGWAPGGDEPVWEWGSNQPTPLPTKIHLRRGGRERRQDRHSTSTRTEIGRRIIRKHVYVAHQMRHIHNTIYVNTLAAIFCGKWKKAPNLGEVWWWWCAGEGERSEPVLHQPACHAIPPSTSTVPPPPPETSIHTQNRVGWGKGGTKPKWVGRPHMHSTAHNGNTLPKAQGKEPKHAMQCMFYGSIKA